MTPDWVSECQSVKLYCGDCRDVLPMLETADVLVTDPPYGIDHPCDYSSRGRAALAPCKDWSDVEGDRDPFDPSHLITLGIPSVLWGGNHYADKLPPRSGWLVWDKERPDELDQATCELAWSNCVKGVRRFRHLWHGMMRASEHGEAYHPMQKPVALFMWTLQLRWIPVGTVLDTYMGSGPCGVAAVRLGRKFLGIEKEPKYFEIAKRRIQEALNSQPLFKEETKEHQSSLWT